MWYHQYGEAGTQQAVTRYAKEYPDATVKVQWTPGDYTSRLNAGLLSSSGPDMFESSLNIDQVKSGQVVALDDLLADTKSDYTEADIKSSTVDGKIYQARAVFVEVDLARCPYRLVGSLLVHPGPRGHAVVRAVGDAMHQEGHR